MAIFHMPHSCSNHLFRSRTANLLTETKLPQFSLPSSRVTQMRASQDAIRLSHEIARKNWQKSTLDRPHRARQLALIRHSCDREQVSE
jgi:hypothetical protein